MMTGNEASILAKHISFFLNEYVPARKTGSANTLKAYQDTIGLYLQFLEQRGTNCKSLAASCFGKDRIGSGWAGYGRSGVTSRRHATTGWQSRRSLPPRIRHPAWGAVTLHSC